MAAEKHLLFVSKPSGYELHERDGAVPEAGSEVEVEEGLRFIVTKTALSPLPADDRACAFLQAV